MQYMSIANFVGGILFASLFWGLLIFAFNSETEIPHDPAWEERFAVFEAAVTENRRVFDKKSQRTLLWTPGNPKTNAVAIQEIGRGKWQVTLEDIY